MTAPKFIDLFSGAGLFSAGMIQAGFEPVLAVDMSKLAVASYNRNVAPCAVVGSVIDLADPPKVDLLIAGPPCQGFSTLGRQDPDDIRNELCLAVLPWIVASEPKVVIFENVPPFLRSQHWQELTRKLVEIGYPDIAAWELDAVDFGTPQRRKRAFTVASRIGPIEAPKPSLRRVTVEEAFSDIDEADLMHTWPRPKGIAAERIALIPPRGGKRDVMLARPDLCPVSWTTVGSNSTDVWGRMDAGQPSNTIRCSFQNPSKGRYIHPTEDRVISLREGARLQGVSDSWTFVGRPYPVARQIGNGVPVPLARAVGEAVAQAMNVISRKSRKIRLQESQASTLF